MRGDKLTAVMWLATATAAVLAAVATLVTGHWLTAMAWAVAAIASLGAAGQSARLHQINRDLGMLPDRRIWDDGNDDGPADTWPADYGPSPDYGPDDPPPYRMP